MINMLLTKESQSAAWFVSRLWSALLMAGGPDPSSRNFTHFRQAFSPAWLDALPLPLGEKRPSTQTVALVDGTSFQREVNDSAVELAYRRQRRTRVYESIEARSDGWFSVAAVQLARLTRCRVVCTMYESNYGDKAIIPHVDAWYGAIVQMRGTKEWTLWKHKSTESQCTITRQGDVLLLPPSVVHAVGTPRYSVHLVFAIMGGEPIM